jgi:hypothetical protein
MSAFRERGAIMQWEGFIAGAISIAVGIVALLYGRRMFWLFAATIGFFFGFFVGLVAFPQIPHWAALLVGIVLGLIGAALANLLKGGIVLLAGALGGGIALTSFVYLIRNQPGRQLDGIDLLVFVIGMALGGISIAFAFDWALIVVSALNGADIIMRTIGSGLHMHAIVSSLFAMILTIIGITYQSADTGLFRADYADIRKPILALPTGRVGLRKRTPETATHAAQG